LFADGRVTDTLMRLFWGRSGRDAKPMAEAQNIESGGSAGEGPPTRLRDALRKARLEAADRTGVVVDLRDAEVARLEILSEALDPLFGQIPEKIDLFDRGSSHGDN